MAQNFMWEIRGKTLQKKVVNAGFELTQPSFQHYREEIKLSNANVLRWINNIPVEKWIGAFDNSQRWAHMIINLIESMNYIFKGLKNLPITALVRVTYFRLGSLFVT